MACETTTLKFIAFIFNILCCIFGAIMLSASAYILDTFNFSNSIKLPCIFGIVIGSLLFLNTLLGIYAATKESLRLTCVYVSFLILLMGAQIAIIFLQRVNFAQLAKEIIDNAWIRIISDNTLMAAYQTKYFCCGKTGPQDYYDAGLNIPPSCYLNQNTTSSTNLINDGCVKHLTEEFNLASRIEVLSDWIVVGVEAITIVIGCILAISLNNAQRRKLYH